MKTGVILLGFACVSLLVLLGVVGYLYYDNDKQLQKDNVLISMQAAEIFQLNTEHTQLVADNVKYMKQSNLKSFATSKDLERFLKSDSTDQEFKNDYASRACINLMRNAREQGYWMGMGIMNQTPENLYTAMLKDRQYGGMSWTTYCVAVVGDEELYMVDPQNDAYVFPVMTMNADWADYSGSEVVNFK